MNFLEFQQICGWDTARYFIISENVFGRLIYYSHLLPAIMCLALALFVYAHNRKNLPSQLLLVIASAFTLWSLFDLILWATEKPEFTIFFWSLLIYLEPIIYAATFYLIYVLVKKEDLTLNKKILGLSLFIPILVLAPTSYNLLGYDFTNCDREAIEGPLWTYTYIVELIFVSLLLITWLRAIKRPKELQRRQVFIAGFGALLFLLTLSWGNITGSLAIDWELGQYGLFGMPIFMGLLAYMIVKYKTFDIKLIGTQALVAALWIMLSAILFIRTIENVRIIVSLTLILFLIIGIQLVRSVNREVAQREKIERLAKDLSNANDKLRELDQMKSEFLSLATHQIRSPLTAIKGYSSMLLEKDYGELPITAREPVRTIMVSSQHLIDIVEDFLNISRIEQGRMVYNKEIFDIKVIIKEAIDELLPNIEKAGLKLNMNLGEMDLAVNADKNKMKQVISNLVDNAIKYTPKGSIEVSAFIDHDKVEVGVKDSGIGIDQSEIDRLFSKFSRTKDAHKTNVGGTGLGLYIAKKMVEAHGGDIKVSSEGKGRGTKFTVELPKYRNI